MHAPGVVSMRRRKPLGFFVPCLVFVVAGLAFLVTGTAAGALGLAFVPGVVITGRQLRRPAYVRIDAASFDLCQLGRAPRTFRFERCGPFSVWQAHSTVPWRMVGFDYRYDDHHGGGGTWSRWGRRLFGFSEAILDLYDVPPDRLAADLEAARTRSLPEPPAG